MSFYLNVRCLDRHCISRVVIRKQLCGIYVRHAGYSDQLMGAGHPGLSNIDFKFIKVCTIIIIIIMILAIKVLVL